MLRTIPGLENVEMMRTGYAIEYDAIVPTQLWPTLETKKIKIYIQQDKLMELRLRRGRTGAYGWN